jgi:hypothetical protein
MSSKCKGGEVVRGVEVAVEVEVEVTTEEYRTVQ